MRGKALFVAAAAGVLLAGTQAHADLIGTTVDSIFFGPDTTAASATDLGTVTVDGTVEYNSATNAAAAQEGVDIQITGTQIIITNLFGGVPFCTKGGTPCVDAFDGFKFIFSGFAAGVNITGVSADAATPADFLPTAPLTSDAADILVDVENDAPLAGDQLILDVALSSPNNNGGGGNNGGGAVPEPASLLMLASGLLALSGFATRRHRVTRR